MWLEFIGLRSAEWQVGPARSMGSHYLHQRNIGLFRIHACRIGSSSLTVCGFRAAQPVRDQNVNGHA